MSATVIARRSRDVNSVTGRHWVDRVDAPTKVGEIRARLVAEQRAARAAHPVANAKDCTIRWYVDLEECRAVVM